MGSNNTKSVALHSAAFASTQLFDDWFDPIEMGVRAQVRSFIEGMIEAELETALSRPRYGRPAKARDGADNAAAGLSGHRHGHRSRSLMGTFGRVEIRVPRTRLTSADGKTSEWKSKTLPAYHRRTRAADALIAGAYLSGTNTRRVRRALAALFGGAVGKDVVSRVWRKVQGDWEAWNNRSLADEPIVRLILDGTVVRVRLDKKATSISLLVVLGVTERVLSLLDARTVAHQPTLGVFSPDESKLIGFSWEGSNSTAYLKSTGGNIALRSNTTDIMTLTSGGNVGISTTGPSYLLHVGSASASGIVAELQNLSGACTYQPGASYESVSCSSDARLKKDIVDTGDMLASLSDMRIRDFTVIADGERRTGVIAQEMLESHPDLVHSNAEGFYTVEQPNPCILVRAIQQLKARTDNTLEAVITGLTDFGVWIAKGQTYIRTLMADQLWAKHVILGSHQAPTGLTLYDGADGSPYCVTIYAGSLVTTKGACANYWSFHCVIYVSDLTTRCFSR